jgi:hypothetical protein
MPQYAEIILTLVTAVHFESHISHIMFHIFLEWYCPLMSIGILIVDGDDGAGLRRFRFFSRWLAATSG